MGLSSEGPRTPLAYAEQFPKFVRLMTEYLAPPERSVCGETLYPGEEFLQKEPVVGS